MKELYKQHSGDQSSRIMSSPSAIVIQKNVYKSLHLLFLLLPGTILASNVTVNTPTGEVIGSVMNYDNISLDVFLGIPFAEPPLGNLRFKKTVPVKPWTSPVIAKNLPPACYQYSPSNYPWEDKVPGQSEDCLYLNIWAPEISNSSEKKAVMFWVFSGGFATGSGRMPLYDGRVLAAYGDVIVVTINYRLSVLGFFTSETEEAPGNVGLYDILEALKWVNKNIAAFGGDNKRITVFGNSAGGVGTGLLCVSPLSKGLFQRAIMQSGCPAYFLNDHRSENLELGQKLAEKMECANETITLKANPDDVTECLRSKDPEELVTTTFHLVPVFPAITFFTIIGDDFLPVDPQKAIREGNFNGVDSVIGVTQDDGSYLFANNFLQIAGPLGELNPRLNKTFGESLMREYFQKIFPDPEGIIQYYLGGVKDDDYDTVRSQVYHSIGDELFHCPSKYFSEKFEEKNNRTYRYYFNHRRKNTRWAEWMKVAHFEEVEFMFGRALNPLANYTNYTRMEEELSLEMVNEWTNFAKTGEPGGMWRAFSRSDPYVKVFELAESDPSILEFHEENCEFFRPYFGF